MQFPSRTAIIILSIAGTIGITQAEEPAKRDAVNSEVAAVAPVPEESLKLRGYDNKTRIIVKNAPVAYLIIISPNGQTDRIGYKRGTDIEYEIWNFPYVEYCWSDKELPEFCPPQYIGRLNASQTTIF